MKRILSALLTAMVVVMFSLPVMAKQPCDGPPGQMKDKNPNAALNSGVGNGAEAPPDNPDCENCDSDPGNSQDNNQAGKNSGNPNSAAANPCDGDCGEPAPCDS